MELWQNTMLLINLFTKVHYFFRNGFFQIKSSVKFLLAPLGELLLRGAEGCLFGFFHQFLLVRASASGKANPMQLVSDI